MLKQKVILSYSSQIGFQLLQVAASIIVARIAGPTVLGTVAFGTAYVSVFMFIADLGMGTAHVKQISEGQDEGKCIATFGILKILTTSLFILVVISFFLIQKYLFNSEFESKVHQYVIFILLAGISIDHFLNIAKQTFAARTEQAKISLVDVSRGLILHPLRIIVVILGFGAIALALSNLASYFLLIPLYLYLFKGYPVSKFDRSLARKYFKISVPVFFIAMSTNVINHIDKVLLQFFTSSEYVGYYTAGFKIGGFILLIGKSVRNLFFPLFSRAVANKDDLYIKNKIQRYENFTFLFITPFIILAIIFSREIILFVLGEEYVESILVMKIITAATFIMILNMPYDNVITGMGKFTLSAKYNMVGLIIFVSLLIVFVHPALFDMKANGVALSLLVTNITLGIIFRFYAKKYFPILSMAITVRFLIYTVFNLGIFHLLYSYWLSDNIFIKIAFILIYIVSTYLSFLILGWINKNDIKDVFSLVDFKSMKNYITNEIRRK